jgi:hypothetical protein
MLASPALAAFLIDLGGVSASIGVFALLMLGSTILTSRLESPRVRSWSKRDSADASQATFGATSRPHARVAPVVAVLAAGYLVIGMLDVLLVVLGIGVLRLGPSGPGYLNAAFGAGGVLGSFTAIWLIGRRRLVSPLLAGAFAWAGLLVALGGWTTAAAAFAMLPAAGLARSLLDISGRTVLLHAAPPDQRARVFGLLEALAMAALALGSLSVPILTWAGGPRVSLVAAGALLSMITLAAGVPLVRVNQR